MRAQPVIWRESDKVRAVPRIGRRALRADEVVIRVGPAVTEELPRLAYLSDLVHVEVAHDQLLVLVRSDLAHELAARIGEVAGAVEVVLAERLDPDAVDGAHEVAVGHGMRRLLELPQVLAQPARGCRRDEDQLGAVEAQGACALREVAVVADVDADLADRGVEHRIAHVAGPEVELLPEALDVRDMRLAVLPKVRAVRIDHRRGVVVDAGGVLVLLVHRDDEDHAGLPGQVLHALCGWAVRDLLGVGVVLRILHLAEVGAVEELLEADDLGALRSGLAGELLVLGDHRFLVARPLRLDQGRADAARHRFLLVQSLLSAAPRPHAREGSTEPIQYTHAQARSARSRLVRAAATGLPRRPLDPAYGR